MNKPVFTYEYDEGLDVFFLYKRNNRGNPFGHFGGQETTDTFMRWLVDLLNKNHEEFTKNRTEQTIREMGF